MTDKQTLRQLPAYRKLMEDFLLGSAPQDRPADMQVFPALTDADWRGEAVALTHISPASGGRWQAGLLLVHPEDPYTFTRVGGQACRTRRLANIVANYSGKVRCGDGQGGFRTLTANDLGLCNN